MGGFDPSVVESELINSPAVLSKLNTKRAQKLSTAEDSETCEEHVPSESSVLGDKKRKNKRKRSVVDESSQSIISGSKALHEDKSSEEISSRKIKKTKNRDILHQLPNTIKGPKNYIKNKNIEHSSSIANDLSDNNNASDAPQSKRKRKKKPKDLSFQKLGHLSQPSKVKRVLPYWIQNARLIGADIHEAGCPIAEMECLRKPLMQTLAEDKIKRFFPVQKVVIPEILKQADARITANRPSDMCVSAATGSGKTLSYVLPLLNILAPLVGDSKIHALVLLPTEQLALEIGAVMERYGRSVGVRVGLAVGSTSFTQEQRALVATLTPDQRDPLLWDGHDVSTIPHHRPLVHVVVATPGRLKDHMYETAGFDLRHLRMIVFDEADHLISVDGGQWVNSIIRAIDRQQAAAAIEECRHPDLFPVEPPLMAQKLLTSATLSCDPEVLDALDLYDPILFTTSAADPGAAHRSDVKEEIEQSVQLGATRPASLREQFVVAGQSVQPLVLHQLITRHSWRKVLVFCHTKATCHRLAMFLDRLRGDDAPYTVAEYTAKLASKQQLVAASFNKGRINVLVCTDSLARGVDFTAVEVVVNYDCPSVGTNYVHRVGRTARAGLPGLALTMLLPSMSVHQFKQMATSTGSRHLEQVRVAMDELRPLEERYSQALKHIKESIASEHATHGSKHAVGLGLSKHRHRSVKRDTPANKK